MRSAREHADSYLVRAVGETATEAGVECDDTVATVRAHPYEAIIDIATHRHCDLIVMASHGRGGMRALLIGSETQKVLTHSMIPVLVVRQEAHAGAARGVEAGMPQAPASDPDRIYVPESAARGRAGSRFAAARAVARPHRLFVPPRSPPRLVSCAGAPVSRTNPRMSIGQIGLYSSSR